MFGTSTGATGGVIGTSAGTTGDPVDSGVMGTGTTGNATGSTVGSTGITAGSSGTTGLVGFTTGSMGITTGGGGTTTGGGNGPFLIPDATAWIDGSTNSYGVQGAIWPYGDWDVCHAAGYTACSSASLAIQPDRSFCATGVAQQVPPAGGSYAYSIVYGSGIGMDWDFPGGDAATKLPYDAVAHGVTGIAFTISGTPAVGVRVLFPAVTQETDPRYVTIIGGGDVSVRFSQATLGYDPTDTVPVNVTELLNIDWGVASNVSNSVPYRFCISNLRVITN
jgi:hypothetical protein